MDVTSNQIDHLGIVAGIYDRLGIEDVIDSRLPTLRHHKISHSDAVKSMAMSALGSVGQRLYLYPEYYERFPIETLLGKGIQASDLNDDALGATLDAIYHYGPTELFNEIMLSIMKHEDLGTKLLHADNTSFSVHEKYEKDEYDDHDSIVITLDHSKDGRKDLNQYVLSMITNQIGIPLFLQAHSGDSSDKVTILESTENIRRGLSFEDDVYFMADSALYSADNLKHLGQSKSWITRIPATIGDAKTLLDADLEMVPCEDPRYSYYITSSEYGDIEQRWVLYQSQPMRARMEKSFEKRLEKNARSAKVSLNKLMRREFACETDARKDADIWLSGHKFQKFSDFRIETHNHRAERKRGRPKKDEKLKTVYVIKAEIVIDEAAVDKAREKLGRFILASNDTKIDQDTMLKYYKGQQSVGRGFRFLKDKRFRVAEVYLEKEEWIEALAMVMVLTLVIYSFAEWTLRKRLRETVQTVPDQKGKPTQRPTMKWISFLFYGVAEVTVIAKGKIHREITNLREPLITVLEMLGPECQKYYGLGD